MQDETDESAGISVQNKLKIGLKITITVAILTVIFVNVEYERFLAILQQSNVALLVCIPLLAAPMIILDSLRWRQVMQGLGYHMSLLHASRYMLVGWFFANLLPGFIGFDGFRIIQMIRLNVAKGVAVQSVIFDRLSAFVSLMVTILIVLPYTLNIIPDNTFRIVVMVVAGAGLATCFVLVLLGVFSEQVTRTIKLSLIQKLTCQASEFVVVFSQARIALSILTSGIGVHLTRACIVFVIALALSIDVSIIECIAIIPIALLIAMIPISFGDWGVREVIFVVALGNIGFSLEEALATSICFGLFRLIVGAIGGLAWLGMKREGFALGKATQG